MKEASLLSLMLLLLLPKEAVVLVVEFETTVFALVALFVLV